MCKGEEFEAFLKDKAPFDKMIYIGDGSNDFCPTLRLREYVSALSHRSPVPYAYAMTNAYWRLLDKTSHSLDSHEV
jgi:hypothetical protein